MEAAVKPKSTGHIRELTIKLKEPIAMNFENMAINNMNLYVGKNGTGKTLVLTLTWIISYITQGQVAAQVHKHPFLLREFAQYVFDHSLSEPQQFSGTVKAVFESGAVLDMLLEEGKITYLDVSGLEGINQPIPAIYMSSNMRLFSSIQMYLKMRKMTGKTDHMEIVAEMVKHFKLYDITLVERMIHRCPIKIDPRIKEALAGFDIKEDITEFGVDLEHCDFYVILADGEKKWMTSYGNGHQSVFNMFIANS